jgi:steroid delta-isomerase-like uncharacterized protein
MPVSARTVARKYFDVLNTGNYKALEQLIAPNYVYHGTGGFEAKGPNGARDVIDMFRKAFPDLHLAVDDLVDAGNKVAVRWTGTGTHNGPLMNIQPTGKKVSITGLIILRLSRGKVVEEWERFEELQMLKQLGVVPS